MSNEKKTLYERLGGYEAITAVANDLLPRLQADPQLGRFWAHRGEDGVKREKQLLIDFPANRLTLQQTFVGAPPECVARGESGLAKADACNPSATGALAGETNARRGLSPAIDSRSRWPECRARLSTRTALARAISLSREAVELFADSDDPERQADALITLGTALYQQGSLAEARRSVAALRSLRTEEVK